MITVKTMASSTASSVYSISLGENTHLRIKYYDTSTGSSVPRWHFVRLDDHIGNAEGRFHIGGVCFSQSSRDIRLAGNNTLRARLATSNGAWWDDEIFIHVEMPTDPAADKPAVSFRPRDNSLRFKGCRNLRLIGGFLLAAECFTITDLSYRESYIDLDECLGSRQGRFNRNGSGFAYKAENVELVGPILYADLSGGTQRRASIDLRGIVRFREDGVMVPLRNVELKHLDYEILRDKPSFEGWWLANAYNVRLVNYRLKRTWFLVADCLGPYGSFQESVIKLHEIIGPWDGQMFSSLPHSTPDLPEDAGHTSLEDGILTAGFMAEPDVWVQRRIDLRKVVANEGGELTGRRSGTDCYKCAGLFFAGAIYTPWTGATWQIEVPENLRWQPLRCTLCRLIQDSVKAFGPATGARHVRIETEGEDYCPTYMGRPRNRRVELVVQPKDTVFQKLQSIMRRNKQPSEPTEVRISLQIELEGSVRAEREKYRLLPAQFRTLPLSMDGVCWLDPTRRWTAIRRWIETCLGEHDQCRGDDVTPDLPSRYLDIGVDDRDAVKVVTSAGGRGDYACLSHCWGGKLLGFARNK